MPEASLSLYGGEFKALISAYNMLDLREFVLYFDGEGLHARTMNSAGSTMMELTIRPDNYRFRDGEGPVYVTGDMAFLYGVAKKFKKNDEVKIRLDDEGIHADGFKIGRVVEKEDIDEYAHEPPPVVFKPEASIRFMIDSFGTILRRADRDPETEFFGIAVEDGKGTLVILDKKGTRIPLEDKDWVLEVKGKAKTIYNVELMKSVAAFPYVAGISPPVATIEFSDNLPARLTYEARDYDLVFYISPVIGITTDFEEILYKPEPEREIVFELSYKDVKSFQSVLRAVNDVGEAARIAPLGDDLFIYWTGGLVKIGSSLFERWAAPRERLSAVFDKIGTLATQLNNVDKLSLGLETEDGELRYVFEVSGPKIGARRIYPDETIPEVKVPTVQGELILRAPTDYLKQAMDDAITAEESFLLVYSTPYSIEMLGRNDVYYEATHPLDGFQTIKDDYVPITHYWFKPLAALCGHLPTDHIMIGKAKEDIYVWAEGTHWEFVSLLNQWEDEAAYKAAVEAYADLVEMPPKPEASAEVKPLAAPIEYAGPLMDPARAPHVEYRSFSRGPFRFVLLNDGEIRVSSMSKFLTSEEIEARPEVLREAEEIFAAELEQLGIEPRAPKPEEVVPPAPPEKRTYAELESEFEGKNLVDVLAALVSQYDGFKRDYRLEDLHRFLGELRRKLTDREISRFYHVYPLLEEQFKDVAATVGWTPPAPVPFIPRVEPVEPAPPIEPKPPRPPTTKLRPEQVEEVWDQFIPYAKAAGILEPMAYRERFIETIRTAERIPQAIERSRRLVTTIKKELRPAIPTAPPLPGVVPGLVPGAEDVAEVYRRLRLPPGATVSETVFQTVWNQIQRERNAVLPAGLTREETDYLFREFRDFLKKFDVEAEKYRAEFEGSVNADLDLSENLKNVMVKARELTDEGRWDMERWR